MLRGLLLVMMMVPIAAFAQGQEFALPEFEQVSDAGVVLSAPPLPEPATPPAPAKAPPLPSWSRGGGSLTVLFTALRDYAVTGEISLLGTVAGTPAPSDAVPGEVEGFLLQLGAQGDYARSGGALCRGTALCATRGAGGLALKGGWARGLPGVQDGVARAQTMYFAQLDVLLSHFDIPSAPLAPGVHTWELMTRLRLGLHFTSEGNRVTSTGVTLLLAAVIEAIPVSSATQGVSLGFSAGLGF